MGARLFYAYLNFLSSLLRITIFFRLFKVGMSITLFSAYFNKKAFGLNSKEKF